MKLFTFLSLFLFITTTAKTQIKKGQFLIGGNISFQSAKSEAFNTVFYKTSTLLISPNIGYFIIDKLAGGIRFDIRSYKDMYVEDVTDIYTSISPFARYYFLPSTRKVNAFLDLTYLNYKHKQSFQSQPNNSSRSYGYNIAAGPTIFFNEYVALEFTLGYRYLTTKNIPDDKSTQFNTGFGLQIHLGKIKTKTNK